MLNTLKSIKIDGIICSTQQNIPKNEKPISASLHLKEYVMFKGKENSSPILYGQYRQAAVAWGLSI